MKIIKISNRFRKNVEQGIRFLDEIKKMSLSDLIKIRDWIEYDNQIIEQREGIDNGIDLDEVDWQMEEISKEIKDRQGRLKENRVRQIEIGG